MRRNRWLPALVVLLTTGLTPRTQGVEPAAPAVPPGQVVESMNEFALDLYQKLASESEDNLFLSPASISTALTMTYAGARGATEAQMAKVLRLPGRDVHQQGGAVVDYLNHVGNRGKLELTVANALWGQSGHPFREDFLGLLKSRYQAGLQTVDFRQQPEAARLRINGWVEQKTNQKIRDLIGPGVLTPRTSLVLTNAIYFRGFWKNPFAAKSTRPLPFTTSKGDEKVTSTMFQKASLRYAEDPAAQCLELPYQGGEMVMTILLPRRGDGLSELKRSLDAAALANWVDKLRPRMLDVYLPKFSLTSEFKLKEVLSGLGMPQAFDEQNADFSAMDETGDLFIQQVVHKGFVDVNEEGTEAAAATGVIMAPRSAVVDKLEFRADHPFLFLIRDASSGLVLFVGRLNDPPAKR